MLIPREKERIAPLLRNGNRYDFLFHSPVSDGFGRALLAPQSEKILILARDVKFFGYVFAGFRHGINAVLCFHTRVYESPAERRVFHFQGARIRAIRLADYKGCS